MTDAGTVINFGLLKHECWINVNNCVVFFVFCVTVSESDPRIEHAFPRKSDPDKSDLLHPQTGAKAKLEKNHLGSEATESLK